MLPLALFNKPLSHFIDSKSKMRLKLFKLRNSIQKQRRNTVLNILLWFVAV